MADVQTQPINGRALKRTYHDNGDGTFSELLAVEGVAGGTAIPVSLSGEAGGATGAVTNPSMTGSSVTAKAANANRVEIILTNNGSVPIYLSYVTPAVSGNGIALTPGATISDDLWKGAVFAIGASGTLSVQEVTP